MIRTTLAFTLALGVPVLAAGCSSQPKPAASKVTTPYRGKADDVTREASTDVLVTTKPVVISQSCEQIPGGDPVAAAPLVARGLAALLPANVTLYVTPYNPVTLDAQPDVVTDDGYAGKLCTPHSFTIAPTPAPSSS
jgi:hypothetical protein